MKKNPMTALLLLLLVLALHPMPARAQGQPVVQAVMFWMDGCPHCHEVLEQVLPPLQEKYGAQLQIHLIEVATTEDIDRLYEIAAGYGYSRDEVGVPFLVIGDHVLIGSGQIPAELPALIEGYLGQGGVDVAEALRPFLPDASSTTSSLPAGPMTPVSAENAAPRDNGFTLAVIVMIGMAVSLVYSAAAFIRGKTFHLPAWTEWLVPVIILIGIGVAGYLSFVETQSVKAVCGPIGDCNAVQQSPYAKVLGFLPVGVLGLFGYLGLLAAWLARKFIPTLKKPAAIAFFGMAFFAVIFSLYLTYLEPFVIKAVCMWCLSSAVIVTVLLLLGTPLVIRSYGGAKAK